MEQVIATTTTQQIEQQASNTLRPFCQEPEDTRSNRLNLNEETGGGVNSPDPTLLHISTLRSSCLPLRAPKSMALSAVNRANFRILGSKDHTHHPD